MNPQIIILEGCDKTGKTTLAKKLSSKLGYKIIHLGVPPENGYFKILRDLIEGNEEGVIFDRFHWGDFVYRGLTKPGRSLTFAEFTELEAKLRAMNAMTIYCYDSAKGIAKRFDEEDLIKASDIPLILSRYNKLLRKTKLDTYYYNQGFQEFLNIIL